MKPCSCSKSKPNPKSGKPKKAYPNPDSAWQGLHAQNAKGQLLGWPPLLSCYQCPCGWYYLSGYASNPSAPGHCPDPNG